MPNDAELERAAQLRTADPAAYAKLSAQTKLAVGYYLNDKANEEAGK